jgi:hypothetical protein
MTQMGKGKTQLCQTQMLPSRVAPACYAQSPDAAILWRNLNRHNPLPPGVCIIFSGATLTASNYDSPFNHSQYE